MAQATTEIQNVIRRYVVKLRENGVPVDRVYLFDSRANQEATKESDLDIAIVSPLFEKMSLWDRAGFLGKAAWEFDCPIDVIGVSPSQMKKAPQGSFLNHIITNGIEIK